MAVRFLAACLLLSAVAGGVPKDPKKDPKFLKSVHGAIHEGVKWLLSKQTASGKFPAFTDTRGSIYELGMHALATLAIIHGGMPVYSKEVHKALKALNSLYVRHRNTMGTYEAGLTLMALEAKYFADPPFLIEKGKLKPVPKKKKKKKKRGKKDGPEIDPEDLKMATALAAWLQTKQKPQGMWRYPSGGVDLSNTQYAALGLWAAQKLGVRVDAGVVQRMIEATLERQQPPGNKVPYILDPKLHRAKTSKTGERRSGTRIDARGWKYLPEEWVTTADGKKVKRVYPYSGSMTTAGIAILVIGRECLKDDKWLTPARDRQLRRSMWEGIAWLQSNWDLRDNPGQPGNWPFYWLYGLERVGRLTGIEYVGLHDWYHEGARRLVTDQRPDGSWPLNQRMRPPGDQNVKWWSDQVDTAFAVLFLARSTPKLEIKPPTITGG